MSSYSENKSYNSEHINDSRKYEIENILYHTLPKELLYMIYQYDYFYFYNILVNEWKEQNEPIKLILDLNETGFAALTNDNHIYVYNYFEIKHKIETRMDTINFLININEKILAGGDDNMKLWDTNTGELLVTYKGSGDYITVLNNNIIVTAEEDGEIYVWNLNNPKPIMSIGHITYIKMIKKFEHNTILVVSKYDKRKIFIYSIDIEKGLKIKDVIESNSDPIKDIVSLDGKIIYGDVQYDETYHEQTYGTINIFDGKLTKIDMEYQIPMKLFVINNKIICFAGDIFASHGKFYEINLKLKTIHPISDNIYVKDHIEMIVKGTEIWTIINDENFEHNNLLKFNVMNGETKIYPDFDNISSISFSNKYIVCGFNDAHIKLYK